MLIDNGFYLALEGLDHVGKSEQIKRLEEHLKADGYDVVVVREPGSSPLAEDLRGVIKRIYDAPTDHMEHLLMFTAARYSLIKHVIKPALAAGKVVLSDRCWISSLLYQVINTEPTTPERESAIEVLRVPLEGAPRPHVLVLLNETLQRSLLEGRDALEVAEADVVTRRIGGYRGLVGRAPYLDDDCRMMVNSYTATTAHLQCDLLNIEEVHELVYDRAVNLIRRQGIKTAATPVTDTVMKGGGV